MVVPGAGSAGGGSGRIRRPTQSTVNADTVPPLRVTTRISRGSNSSTDQKPTPKKPTLSRSSSLLEA